MHIRDDWEGGAYGRCFHFPFLLFPFVNRILAVRDQEGHNLPLGSFGRGSSVYQRHFGVLTYHFTYLDKEIYIPSLGLSSPARPGSFCMARTCIVTACCVSPLDIDLKTERMPSLAWRGKVFTCVAWGDDVYVCMYVCTPGLKAVPRREGTRKGGGEGNSCVPAKTSQRTLRRIKMLLDLDKARAPSLNCRPTFWLWRGKRRLGGHCRLQLDWIDGLLITEYYPNRYLLPYLGSVLVYPGSGLVLVPMVKLVRAAQRKVR